MIIEIIIIAILLMIIFGLLKWMMKIGMKVFIIAILVFIIMALLGYIF
ncbi:MAG: hypothetical protein J6O99_02500 [Methanobrevibacter sp.]|jgi:hypothetical protein|nr:hypothetical protein [Methanobrevibacter sp.]MBO5840765.1 hypothetical protein [Methanobrevibacter sp.]MBO5965635.1 hypothetical protein [Methanobrevibacter sp.]MBO6104753.1 hypothetical protein [Methanobrevibacter sp.]MBO7159017.1 hypothetical protein [Methanobrevibacter sp.]MBO7444513.1 hypothetical protein [Methanobrevibacter sp.]